LNLTCKLNFKSTKKPIENHAIRDDSNKNEQFNVELELIKDIHINCNTHPSIIHFSFNKSATQYIKSLLTRCATSNGMIPVGINDFAFNTDFPFLDHLSAEEMLKYRHIFKPEGYIYTVFGGMVEGIERLEKYKVVLGVRDPRDMLVSSYFSQAFSHVIPDEKGNKQAGFMARREFALRSTIDEYVLAESEKLNRTFLKYHELLLQKYPTIYVARYEDMLGDFGGWLKGLIEYCDLEVSAELFDSIMAENEGMKPADEDVSRHLRKGLPGDYLDKLQPATIKFLNDKFTLMLERFGYSA